MRRFLQHVLPTPSRLASTTFVQHTLITGSFELGLVVARIRKPMD